MNQAEQYKNYSAGQKLYGLKLMDLLNLSPGGRVIDIGSGTGNLTYELAKRVTETGKVSAIDPDTQRMIIAKDNQPDDITNIDWFNGTVENFINEINCYDFAYSNYVLHWVPNQQQVIKKIFNLLKPGAIFALNVVINHPEVIEDLLLATGSDGVKLRNSFYYLNKGQWHGLLEDTGFTIEHTSQINNYRFENFDELLTWWQATTHGMFTIDMLSAVELKKLNDKHNSHIDIYSKETLSLIARKM